MFSCRICGCSENTRALAMICRTASGYTHPALHRPPAVRQRRGKCRSTNIWMMVQKGMRPRPPR
nr:hypothetical protein RVX_1068 [Nitratidesulfovibrio sp. HK-II]